MQIEATGKSVEIAIQNGLLECGMKREDVEVKVVDNGGLFKKAKVILSWGEKPVQEEVEENLEVETQEEAVAEETTEEVEEVEKPIEKKVKIFDTSRIEEKGKEFLLGLVKFIDENASVETIVGENEVTFSVKGENLGKLIGYHGENIAAVQMLMSGLKTRGEGAIRLYVDID